MSRVRSIAISGCIANMLHVSAAPGQLPYRNKRLSVETRVRDLVGRMTPDEKFWQLFMIPGNPGELAGEYRDGIFGVQVTGADTTGIRATLARADAQCIAAAQRFVIEHTRLGTPIIPFEEGVHGLVRPGATVFPAAIALAATWDTTLMSRVATAIAAEARSRGIRQLLSPVINIATDVRWGRTEETYGEDPYLTSVMAQAYVGALERNGVIATPKHFVANVGDGGRDSYPISLDDRTLQEVHFPPFQAALAAGAHAVMTSYNSVGGVPSTQNAALLNGWLKRRWKFDGFVISDAAATGGATVLHYTEPTTAAAASHAFRAGLDVVFQSSYPQHRPYLDAFRRRLIPDSVVDASVARVLRAKFRLGLFDQPYGDAETAARLIADSTHRQLAREVAVKTSVLLRNEHHVLPLGNNLRSIAVIGPEADTARLGGYTAPGARGISLIEGIRRRAGTAAVVRFARGTERMPQDVQVVPSTALTHTRSAGLQGEYYDNIALTGAAATRVDNDIDFSWTLSAPMRGMKLDWYSIRWTGEIAVPDGVRRLGLQGDDGYRMWIDDSLVIDNWAPRSNRTMTVPVASGTSHSLRIEFHITTPNAHIRLVWQHDDAASRNAAIDSAVAIARASDVAIVAVGIEEGEFRDRSNLSLPGRQEELIRRVAETGTPTVVVLTGGSAITMTRWMDSVDAILLEWYAGEEGGNAVAQVLFGDDDPGGRLPITFPISEGQLPLVYNHRPTGRGDDYLDLTGQPQFPFGYGLSYTSFSYDDSHVDSVVGPLQRVTVRFKVTNSGSRAGDDVAQLYLRDMLASVAQPVTALKRFEHLHLQPGETRQVEFVLTAADLRLLDAAGRWVVEPGTFSVMIGTSARDIRLRSQFTVR